MSLFLTPLNTPKNAEEIEESLMTFLELLTKRVTIESFASDDRRVYLNAVVQFLSAFSKAESGRKRLEIDEERFHDDLLLTLRILLHLTDGCGAGSEMEIAMDTIDAIMVVVEIVVPLLTPVVLSVSVFLQS